MPRSMVPDGRMPYTKPSGPVPYDARREVHEPKRMSDLLNILGSVWWMIVTLGVLVTFHEFGHFWVARRCGVKVLRFSIGFGKPLWSHVGRDGVEYAIGAIPLGGYVKFLDAREADNPELIAHLPGEYNAAPVWQRMSIAIAGP